jgi:hypothetical protein
VEQGQLHWRALGNLVGPACVAAATITHGRVTLALIVLGIALSGLYFVYTEMIARGRQSELRDARISDVLETARGFLAESGARDIRANLMVPISGDTLQVRCRAGDYDPSEIEDTWERGVGCAGIAFDRGRTVLGARTGEERDRAADQSDADVIFEVLSARPAIPKERIESVMSVPIRDQRSGRTIGVLNFDDRLVLSVSPLSRASVIITIERLANRLVTTLAEEEHG